MHLAELNLNMSVRCFLFRRPGFIPADVLLGYFSHLTMVPGFQRIRPALAVVFLLHSRQLCN